MTLWLSRRYWLLEQNGEVDDGIQVVGFQAVDVNVQFIQDWSLLISVRF